MSDKHPGWQKMLSLRENAESVKRHFADCLQSTGATESDIKITNMDTHVHYRDKNAIETTYELHWTSYVGWRAYMLMTGCYAS